MPIKGLFAGKKRDIKDIIYEAAEETAGVIAPMRVKHLYKERFGKDIEEAEIIKVINKLIKEQERQGKPSIIKYEAEDGGTIYLHICAFEEWLSKGTFLSDLEALFSSVAMKTGGRKLEVEKYKLEDLLVKHNIPRGLSTEIVLEALCRTGKLIKSETYSMPEASEMRKRIVIESFVRDTLETKGFMPEDELVSLVMRKVTDEFSRFGDDFIVDEEDVRVIIEDMLGDRFIRLEREVGNSTIIADAQSLPRIVDSAEVTGDFSEALRKVVVTSKEKIKEATEKGVDPNKLIKEMEENVAILEEEIEKSLNERTKDYEETELALASELFDVMIKMLSSMSDEIEEIRDLLEDFTFEYREQVQKISPLINKGSSSQIEEFSDYNERINERINSLIRNKIENLNLIGERMDIFTRCAAGTQDLLRTLSEMPLDTINTEDLQEILQGLTVIWAQMFNLNLNLDEINKVNLDEISKAAVKIMKKSSERIRKEKEKIGDSEVVAEMEKYADLLEQKGGNTL